MAELTNEEIRKKLLNFNYDCGPVTATTREILLKKLKSLNDKAPAEGKQDVGMSDEELRAQLTSYGFTVAPITADNRDIYLRRLKIAKESSIVTKGAKRKEDFDVKEVKREEDFDEWEPMEVD